MSTVASSTSSGQRSRAMSLKGPSNSIIITNLPRIFFHPNLQSVLRAHFNSYGTTQSWTPFEELNKIHVVYSNYKSAQLAKEDMNGLIFDEFEIHQLVLSLLDDLTPVQSEEKVSNQLLNGLEKVLIKVYFGPEAPIFLSKKNNLDKKEKEEESLMIIKKREEIDFLKPPNFDKNFLISPPGSPPVGWEQIIEDAPNQKNLADDLCQRLRFLSVDNEGNSQQVENDNHQSIPIIINNNNSDDPVKKTDDNSNLESIDLNEIILLPQSPDSTLPALKIHPIHSTHQSPGMDIHLVKSSIVALKKFPLSIISPTPMPPIS